MTANEFNQLNSERKADIIWEWGFLVSQAKHNNRTFLLFSLNNFYVEQCIFASGSEMISAITKREFQNHNLTDFYNVNPVTIQMIDTYALSSVN